MPIAPLFNQSRLHPNRPKKGRTEVVSGVPRLNAGSPTSRSASISRSPNLFSPIEPLRGLLKTSPPKVAEPFNTEENGTPPQCLENSEHQLPAAQDGQDSPVLSEIYRQLRKRGFPQFHVHFALDAAGIILTGRVSRYYYLQIILEVVRRCSNGQSVLNQIEVTNDAARSTPQ